LRRKKNPRRFDFIEFACLGCEFISPRLSFSSAQLARFMKDQNKYHCHTFHVLLFGNYKKIYKLKGIFSIKQN